MGNRYDLQYNFRKANIEDVDDIMSFIRMEWGDKHILGLNRELFLWQYGRTEYQDEKGLNFILMTDKEDTILGMIGYVSYDANNESISPTMTKVSSKVKTPMAGLEFMKRQMIIVHEKEHFASGTNPKTILPLYEKVFHHRVGCMQQYYIINPNINDFHIAKINHRHAALPFIKTRYSLRSFSKFDEMMQLFDCYERHERLPFKSPEFIKKRYFSHPIYRYKKWYIENEKNDIVGLLFGREITQNGARIMRLVDYRGNLFYLSKLGESFYKLLKEEGYEYIDLMASDLSEYHLEQAGFDILVPEEDVVIPNYFEPFLQQNVKNFYQTKTNIVIFKADGDQDRPSIIGMEGKNT